MNQLCSVSNQTYAYLNLNDDRLANIKGNELVGIFGEKVDFFLIKKHLRKCKIIGEPTFGERLDNGTWTGNLGLIQKGDAILYLKSEPLLIDTSIENWMSYSVPYYREKYHIIHDIDKEIAKASAKENTTNILNCFNFDLTIILSLILATLISIIIAISLKLLSNQINEKRRISIGQRKVSICKRIKNILINCLNSDWNLNYSKLTTITIFILFYSLYLWFIQLIIANNIKTDKVIVDQSILIKDEHEALTTKKTFCFLEGETELKIALNYNSSILGKLYNQKNILPKPIEVINIKKGERCIISKSMDTINIENKENFGIISNSLKCMFLSLIGRSKPDLILWINSKPIFETNHHLIMRNRKDIIESYNRITSLYAETGIIEKFYDLFNLDMNEFFQSHIVYTTIEEFINGNSKFTDLKIESFKLLFIIYVSICLTIFFVFLLHCLLVKTKFFHFIFSKLCLMIMKLNGILNRFNNYFNCN